MANETNVKKPQRFNSTLSLLYPTEGASFFGVAMSKGIPKRKDYKNLRYYVRKAFLNGTLKKPKECSMCGRSGLKINGHHEDYSKPLDVIWVCNRCHIRVLHCGLPREYTPPKPKKRVYTETTKRGQFIIEGKNYHVPLLKTEPYNLCGLFIDKYTIDERDFFPEHIYWPKYLEKLSYREREIIKLRYGLGDGDVYTLEEVAKIFKVTRERVRQIEIKAIRKLRRLLS